MHTFAFAAGGFLPASQRGKSLGGMIHICDFYSTFVAMAGGDPDDKGGPAPLDSLDQSGYLLGTAATSARTVIVHDHYYTPHAAELRHSDVAQTVTLRSKYPNGCNQHFTGFFWLSVADLAAIGVKDTEKVCSNKGCGAVTIKGETFNLDQINPHDSTDACTDCGGCKLAFLKLAVGFSVGGLGLSPGSNATMAWTATPAPAPPPGPPPPPKLEATGAIRVGDYKLLVGPQRMATWFGAFSPNATFNGSSTGTTACAERPCLFNSALPFSFDALPKHADCGWCAVAQDPTEHEDLADAQPAKAAELLKTFYSYNSQYHPGPPIGSDHDGYCAAAAAHKGFMVPWRSSPDWSATTAPPLAHEQGDPTDGMDERELAAFMAGGGL